jgi:hypothetical protein
MGTDEGSGVLILVVDVYRFLCETVVIVPIIGVGLTQGLSQHTSLYPKDQKSESGG